VLQHTAIYLLSVANLCNALERSPLFLCNQLQRSPLSVCNPSLSSHSRRQQSPQGVALPSPLTQRQPPGATAPFIRVPLCVLCLVPRLVRVRVKALGSWMRLVLEARMTYDAMACVCTSWTTLDGLERSSVRAGGLLCTSKGRGCAACSPKHWACMRLQHAPAACACNMRLQQIVVGLRQAFGFAQFLWPAVCPDDAWCLHVQTRTRPGPDP